MDHWFDELTKQVASGTLSRREVVRQITAAALATLGAPLLGRPASAALQASSNGHLLGALPVGAAPVNGISYGSGKSIVAKTATDTFKNELTTLHATVSRTVLHGAHAGPYFDPQKKRMVAVPAKAALSTRWVVTRGKETALTVESNQPTPGHLQVDIEYGAGFSGGKHLMLVWNNGQGSGSLDGRALRPFTKNDSRFFFSDGQPVAARTVDPVTKTAIDRAFAKFKAQAAADLEPVQLAFAQTIAQDGSNNPPPPNMSNCDLCQWKCGGLYALCLAGVVSTCAATCGITCVGDFIAEATGNGCVNATQNCVNNCSNPGNACCPASCNVDGSCCEGNGAHCCTFGNNNQTCCGPNQACCKGGCCPTGLLCDAQTVVCCNPAHGPPCGAVCCGSGQFCGNPGHDFCCPKGTKFCAAYPATSPQQGICCAPGTTCCSNFKTPGAYGSSGGMVCCPNDDYVCIGSYGFRGPCIKKSEVCGNYYCPGVTPDGKPKCKNHGCCLTGNWCGDTCCEGQCCSHNKNLCCGLCLSGQRTTLGTCCNTGTACGTKCCPTGCANPRTSTCKSAAKCAAPLHACTSSMRNSSATEIVCCPSGRECYNGRCCAAGKVACQNPSRGGAWGCWAPSVCQAPPK
jgi:hypothetical protein